MSSESTYRKHSVLFIDDEEQSQKYFSQIFSKTFNVLLASDGEKGLDLFRQNKDKIGVVVSDQRMPGMSGSQLLAEVAKEKPDIVNILSTAYSDLDAAIDAVNDGGIYRYVTKPWDLAELDVTLRRAMDYYILKEQVRQLSKAKLSGIGSLFHQSRLLACMAIPALSGHGAIAINAFRDLMQLSLSDEGNRDSHQEAIAAILSSANRAEQMEKFHQDFGTVLELVKSSESLDLAQAKSQLQSDLVGDPSNDGKPALVTAFFALLQDRASPADLEKLALLLGTYSQGLQIRSEKGQWALKEGVPITQDNFFEELCSLFVDDSFLVSCVLRDLV